MRRFTAADLDDVIAGRRRFADLDRQERSACGDRMVLQEPVQIDWDGGIHDHDLAVAVATGRREGQGGQEGQG
jgi:hypothetical protein